MEEKRYDKAFFVEAGRQGGKKSGRRWWDNLTDIERRERVAKMIEGRRRKAQERKAATTLDI